MRVGGICFFCFHHQGIWIGAKVVKIWEYVRKFCYGYFDNPYNSFIRFQRFRFSSDDLPKISECSKLYILRFIYISLILYQCKKENYGIRINL